MSYLKKHRGRWETGSRPTRGVLLGRAAVLGLALSTGVGPPLRAQVTARTDSVLAARTPLRPRPLLAVLEGLALNVLVNRFDASIRVARDLDGIAWARVTPRDWSRNIRLGWVWDTDAFVTNMFGHPYNGSMYFNAGRANGLDFWESAPLPFLGSLTWEYFGEVYQPSLNDFYNTGFGGIVLGEVYHRLGALVRDNRGTGVGRVLRELAAVPLDPMGSLDRVLHGGFTRVGPNPADRHPGTLGLVVQAGGRVAVDSGEAGRSTSASFVVDLEYGDPFRQRYTQPFDVFRARLQVSPGGGGVNILRVWGRLWAREITPDIVRSRHILTVNQKSEFVGNPAYKFGAQSVEVGLVSGFAATRRIDVRTEVFAEALLMGAVDARRTGILGSERTYDFGPGGGLVAAASVHVAGTPVFSARWHWAYVHSVSGSPADHYVQFAAAEAVLPVTPSLGIGADAGWYQRRSTYEGRFGEATRFPEFRAFLTWQPRRLRSVPENP